MPYLDNAIYQSLRRGLVISASPLALDCNRRLDERRQRALWRYYSAAGAGGIAVGVHTTQFAIRDPKIGLFEPLLSLAADELARVDSGREEPLFRVAGICGPTDQAVAEAALARDRGFHAGLLNLAALDDADDNGLIAHAREVADRIPLFGFYFPTSLGGPVLSYAFWRQFVEIEAAVAIKIAAFSRYQTLDVVRALAESGREDIALYTGNDDNIVLDLITPYRFSVEGRAVQRRFVGGLLGHWAVWTRQAVQLHERCRQVAASDGPVPADLLRTAVEVTDTNSVFFDAAHNFAGCVPGLHEVLRRQGLLEGVWTLDPREGLSPGQSDGIDRLYRAYPHLSDDPFVAEHRDEWLKE